MELEPWKLRKVAFCVDVEVAPTCEDIEARKEARRRREEEREEVEKSAEEKAQTEGETKTLDAETPVGDAELPPAERISTTESQTSSGDKEHKKRKRINKRPTTDPVRIYTQCCMLRETQQVSAIKHQLPSLPSTSTLNLTSLPLSLPDTIALADFLALVPLKTLILDSSALTDEKLRLLLSALTAVRSPPPPSSAPPPRANEKHHYPRGAIEMLSLKNNPSIGGDGWKYIIMFIHTSHSLKSLNISGIPLPSPPATSAPCRCGCSTN